MRSSLKATIAALILSTTALPAIAQENPSTILVLDASGSMWGQIDGVNKITIAREVVANILADFPRDQNLGFVTYGHRERGQCSDIQTVIQPAPGTAPEIIKIVSELNPRGMTPMTDAVIAAAEALRHTEQPATVILVSDGIETCNPDPCAAARALEQAGIDFTAHVIGFDVRGEAEALMQMQCIAEETGGRFLTADNAQELTEALQQVVAAPASGTFTFTANLGGSEVGVEPVWDWQQVPLTLPLVPGDVLWEISDNEHSFVQKSTGNPFTVDLPFGEYVVTVHSEAHDVFSQIENAFSADSIRNIHAIFPPALTKPVEVSMIAVTGGADGPQVETPVTWTFEIEGDGFELDGNPGVTELRPGQWSVTGYHAALERDQSVQLTIVAGEPVTHVMVFDDPQPDLPQATVSAPAQVVVGSAFPVTWEAEGLDPRDYVTIVPAGADAGSYTNYDRLSEGKIEASLRAPAEPGLYEVRLQTEGAGRVLAITPIEVVDVEVTVSAPTQVIVGSAFPVTWTAEGLHPRDYVTIVPAGAEEGAYTNYDRMEGKAEGGLRAPAEPGLYEVRLQMEGSGRVLAITPVEVVDAEVTVSAPAEVLVGSQFAVSWAAEGLHPRDYVTIVAAGAEEGAYTDYDRMEGKAEGSLRAPAEPGLYEVRLQMEGSGRVLATTPVEVMEGNVIVSGPERVRAGTEMALSWTGAIYSRDYVTIVPAGTEDGEYADYIRVGSTTQGKMTAPAEPGLYEIRYHLERESRVMARHPVEVLAADAPMDEGAGLVVPAAGTPGETVTISWTGGADSADQRVTLARADQADFSWIYAENAIGRNSLEMTLPDAPGTYEVRFLDIAGRSVLGRSIVEVQP